MKSQDALVESEVDLHPEGFPPPQWVRRGCRCRKSWLTRIDYYYQEGFRTTLTNNIANVLGEDNLSLQF
jgi:hypothetical protein